MYYSKTKVFLLEYYVVCDVLFVEHCCSLAFNAWYVGKEANRYSLSKPAMRTHVHLTCRST